MTNSSPVQRIKYDSNFIKVLNYENQIHNFNIAYAINIFDYFIKVLNYENQIHNFNIAYSINIFDYFIKVLNYENQIHNLNIAYAINIFHYVGNPIKDIDLLSKDHKYISSNIEFKGVKNI